MTPLLLVLSFLRVDVESGAVTKWQWDAEQSLAIGSLAKPFVAVAFAQSHNFEYPHVLCKRCWLPRGHGDVGIEDAIAQSCNTYFDYLRQQLSAEEMNAVARRFGLPSLDAARPEALLKAYIELSKRAGEPGVAPVLDGMRRSARSGTSKGLNVDALAKTGTAPCTHKPKAPGDGFVVVLYPAVKPRTALLVRLHSRPGSHAAREAARLLQ